MRRKKIRKPNTWYIILAKLKVANVCTVTVNRARVGGGGGDPNPPFLGGGMGNGSPSFQKKYMKVNHTTHANRSFCLCTAEQRKKVHYC